jgi:hypothetical protein
MKEKESVFTGSRNRRSFLKSGTTNLIMPEPTLFLNQKLGPVSIIRPTSTQQGGAVASVQSFIADGLFLDPATNKNTGIVKVLFNLAEQADGARRRF